jgi:hypothetical protein
MDVIVHAFRNVLQRYPNPRLFRRNLIQRVWLAYAAVLPDPDHTLFRAKR